MPDFLILRVSVPDGPPPAAVVPLVTRPRARIEVVGIVKDLLASEAREALNDVPVPPPGEKIVVLRWDNRVTFEPDPGYVAAAAAPEIDQIELPVDGSEPVVTPDNVG